MIFLNATKSFVFYFKKPKSWVSKPIVLYGFLAIYLLATIFFWDDWKSILPMIAICFVTFSNWQTNPQTLRWLFLPSNISWFIYNLLIGSSGGMIAETIMFVMILSSLAKHYYKK
jgi:hypothetical protein